MPLTAGLSRFGKLFVLGFAVCTAADGAHFITEMTQDALSHYKAYVARSIVGTGAAANQAEAQWSSGHCSNGPQSSSERPVICDLNPSLTDGGQKLLNGAIHHWIGAIELSNVSSVELQNILQNYAKFGKIFGPEIACACGTNLQPEGSGVFDNHVTMALYRQVIGFHFAFKVQSTSRFVYDPGSTTLIVSTASEDIRESVSGISLGDLMDKGRDHGILWQINTYWRAVPRGANLYVQYEVISLSRDPPWFAKGFVGKEARNAVQQALIQIKAAAEGKGASREQAPISCDGARTFAANECSSEATKK